MDPQRHQHRIPWPHHAIAQRKHSNCLAVSNGRNHPGLPETRLVSGSPFLFSLLNLHDSLSHGSASVCDGKFQFKPTATLSWTELTVTQTLLARRVVT